MAKRDAGTGTTTRWAVREDGGRYSDAEIREFSEDISQATGS